MNNLKTNEQFENFLKNIPAVKGNTNDNIKTKLVTCSAVNCTVTTINKFFEVIQIAPNKSAEILTMGIEEEEVYVPIFFYAVSQSLEGPGSFKIESKEDEIIVTIPATFDWQSEVLIQQAFHPVFFLKPNLTSFTVSFS